MNIYNIYVNLGSSCKRKCGICFSDTAFNTITYSSIHFSLIVMISFFFVYQSNSCVCIYYIFVFYSSADGHLGWFHTLAIVNSTAINVDVRGCNIVGSYGRSICHFWGIFTLISLRLHQYAVCTGSSFSVSSPVFAVICFLSDALHG